MNGSAAPGPDRRAEVTSTNEARQVHSLPSRLWAYQAERFPLAGFVPLIAAFAFSSAAFSRLSRGHADFIEWPRFVMGAFSTIAFFFLLRVLDEHKDQDLDRRFRPELPVPRGLVSLAELRTVGTGLLVLVLLANALVEPVMLVAIIPIGVWVALMTKEFFVRDWLRAHPAAYLLSHMVVLPVIDVYTTGLDWLAEGVSPPRALLLFLGVTFANGVLIEIGRKIKVPGDERVGVDTYSATWGRPAAVASWVVSLAASVILSVRAAASTGAAALSPAVFIVPGVVAAIPAAFFLARPARHTAKAIETASQLWPLVTYLMLGGAPFVLQWFGTGAP